MLYVHQAISGRSLMLRDRVSDSQPQRSPPLEEEKEKLPASSTATPTTVCLGQQYDSKLGVIADSRLADWYDRRLGLWGLGGVHQRPALALLTFSSAFSYPLGFVETRKGKES